MNDFTQEVIEIIKTIPYGKVMTYGQISSVAGNPWGARQVSRILHSMSTKYNLPWHRVINSKGEISLSGEGFLIQKQLLTDEGVIVIGNKINLNIYQHIGG
jgi:methylated-DNA-protein-cysteine methyltransferase-like protein